MHDFLTSIEQKQLELLTNRFKNKPGYIDKLLSFEHNQGLYPEALNNFGVRVYNGLEKIQRDKLLAREVFAYAYKHGSVWAIYNLAVCLINDEPKDPREAHKLFSLLLPEVRPSNYDFKNYEHSIYYFSGLYYSTIKDYKKSGECFYLVPDNSPHYEKARLKLASLPIPCMAHGSFWKEDIPVVLIANSLAKSRETHIRLKHPE